MGNEGTENVPQVEVTATPEQPPVAPSPTAEEQLKSLQAQLVERDKILAQKEEAYKGLQRTVNKSNEELRKQADLRHEIDSVKDHIKILAAAYSEKQVVEENIDNIPQGKKQDLLGKFEELQKKQEFKRQQEALLAQAREFQSRTEALGLKEVDESYVEIQELVESGRFKTADIRLKKLEAAKVPDKKEVPQDDEARINKLVEERLQKLMQEKGLLKTDTAVPSGRAKSREDIIKAYGDNDPSVTEQDFLKALGRR